MTKLAKRLELVSKNPQIFQYLNRGIERETLRYTPNGRLASTPHPSALGSALTHEYITTDFAESLLEFITPVTNDIPSLISRLSDVHKFAYHHIGGEYLWPLSMPCFVEHDDDIQIAQYGSSNVGQMKTLYRQGLKNRYGSLMQIISGVHFNFSFPESFWDALYGAQTEQERQETRSQAYLGVIRNYYRYGWLIPYLFGASPALCSSFIKNESSSLPFESIGNTKYLPYATSLRLSDLGYTNSSQSSLKINFNSLEQYLEGLESAIKTPSDAFAAIGMNKDGVYQQLNSNVLQIENELYAPIRPKRVALSGEKPSEALSRDGIEYIEVRSLDVNPFSPIGIDETQIRFLDLFLVWSALKDSELMTNEELMCWRENWDKVILQGRKPNLMLKLGCQGQEETLHTWGTKIFSELNMVAELMDAALGDDTYQQVCRTLVSWINDPEKTLSNQLLQRIQEAGSIKSVGCSLGESYKHHHTQREYQSYSEQEMHHESLRSQQAQKALEAEDTVSFETYLETYFHYIPNYKLTT